MSEEKKKEFTLEEIAKHNTQESCWLIIGNLNNGAFHLRSLMARRGSFIPGSQTLLLGVSRHRRRIFVHGHLTPTYSLL